MGGCEWVCMPVFVCPPACVGVCILMFSARGPVCLRVCVRRAAWFVAVGLCAARRCPVVESNICFGLVVPLGCFSIGFPQAGPEAVTSARLC